MSHFGQQQTEAMLTASGGVTLTDPLVEFLYVLTRDYLRFGAIEDIIIKDLMPLGPGNHEGAFINALMVYVSIFQINEIRNDHVTGEENQYANGWVAQYCLYTAQRIRGEITI